MQISYYYDETAEQTYSSDPEGTLVLLCPACAAKAGREVAWAGDGFEGAQCELCEAGEGGQAAA